MSLKQVLREVAQEVFDDTRNLWKSFSDTWHAAAIITGDGVKHVVDLTRWTIDRPLKMIITVSCLYTVSHTISNNYSAWWNSVLSEIENIEGVINEKVLPDTNHSCVGKVQKGKGIISALKQCEMDEGAISAIVKLTSNCGTGEKTIPHGTKVTVVRDEDGNFIRCYTTDKK